MSEENKAIAHRLIEELWNGRNPDLIDDIYTPDHVHHLPDGDVIGSEGFREVYDLYTTAFPDCRFTIEDLVAEGNKVVFHYTFTGTHNGDLGKVAPTGRRVRVPGIGIMRVEGGKVADERALWDTLGLMQQIGAVTPPGES